MGLLDAPPIGPVYRKPLTALYPPRDMPSVLAHFDFSQLSGASGSSVSFAADQSGNGNHLSQPTTASQPTVGVHANGKKILALGSSGTATLQRTTMGNGDMMQPSTGYAQPLTIVAAARATTEAPNGSAYRLLVGASAVDLAMTLDTSLACLSMRGGSTLSGGPALNDGNWHILTAVWGLSGGALYVDGYLVNTQTTQVGSNALKGLVVGATTGAAAPWHGDVAEIVVCNAQATQQQINAVTAYLGAKW